MCEESWLFFSKFGVYLACFRTVELIDEKIRAEAFTFLVSRLRSIRMLLMVLGRSSFTLCSAALLPHEFVC